MSKPGDEDDPLWRRVKAQTRPLVRKQEQTQHHLPPQARKLPCTAPRPSPTQKPARTPKTGSPEPQKMSGHRRVRRGRLYLGWKTDLHGYCHDDARTRLLDDLLHCRSMGVQTVLVITGKGKGILREALPRWLNQPDFAQIVSGYAPAHARHGGSGAWYVFVRIPKRGN